MPLPMPSGKSWKHIFPPFTSAPWFHMFFFCSARLPHQLPAVAGNTKFHGTTPKVRSLEKPRVEQPENPVLKGRIHGKIEDFISRIQWWWLVDDHKLNSTHRPRRDLDLSWIEAQELHRTTASWPPFWLVPRLELLDRESEEEEEDEDRRLENETCFRKFQSWPRGICGKLLNP